MRVLAYVNVTLLILFFKHSCSNIGYYTEQRKGTWSANVLSYTLVLYTFVLSPTELVVQ